jgi:ATPase subunit of ABC transporter with duplicated ATPase domains
MTFFFDVGLVVFTLLLLYITNCFTQPLKDYTTLTFWKGKFFSQEEVKKEKKETKQEKPQIPVISKEKSKEIKEKLQEIPVIPKEKTEKEIENEKKKENILEEILQTEEDYVDHLTVLIEKFKKPLTEKKIISDASLTILFGNIEVVYGVNKMFLENLKNSLKEKDKREENLSEMIVWFSKSFRLYTSRKFFQFTPKVTLQIMKKQLISSRKK